MKTTFHKSPTRSEDSAGTFNRHGAALIVALVCVAVTGVLMFSVVRLAASNREVMRSEMWQLQAGWLADSGIERAAARLAADPQYRGETWAIPANSLSGSDAASVRVEVDSPADQPGRRVVRVRADFPDHPYLRARASREAVFVNKE